MELSLDLNKRYTYADYLTWMDDKARELINGFIKTMSPAPRPIHVEISSNIMWELKSVVKKNKGKCKVYHAPFDVRFPRNGETANDAGTVYGSEGNIPVHIFDNYPIALNDIFEE